MYDKLSSKAEEFIDHDEIMASINWADENKHQMLKLQCVH